MLLAYAASVEAHSEHPIAQGIIGSAESQYPVTDFKEIPGKCAEGKVKGRDVKVVSPGYLKERDIYVDDEQIDKLSGQGKTVVWVLIDNIPAGAIVLADIIRRESKRAITMLKKWV